MASGVLAVLAALLVSSPAVAFVGSNFQPLPFGYQQPVYGVVPVRRESPRQLSCVQSAPRAGIAVNIKEKHHGYGGSGPQVFNSFFQQGFSQFQSLGGGLSADFEVFASRVTKAYLVFTEKAFVDRNFCQASDFGKGLSPSSEYGVGAPYGDAGLGFNFGAPQLFFGAKGHGSGYGQQTFPAGVVAEVDLSPETVKSISLNDLNGFSNIRNLAGRGLVVCTNVEADYDNKAVCTGEILACCSLTYDHQDRSIFSANKY